MTAAEKTVAIGILTIITIATLAHYMSNLSPVQLNVSKEKENDNKDDAKTDEADDVKIPFCYNRWMRERSNCSYWYDAVDERTSAACLDRARNRYMLCVGNGGTPDEDEPDEWDWVDIDI